MKIKCILKPDEDYIERAVTVGKTYDVINKDDNDYLLVDDNGNKKYYQLAHFIEI